MTTVIETSNGWAVSATVACSPTASAPTPRRGVGLIVKTARRSHAPNTWRGQLDWRHVRPTAARKTRRRAKAECGENVTAPRGHDKALR